MRGRRKGPSSVAHVKPVRSSEQVDMVVSSLPLPCEGESRPGNDVVSKLLYKVEAMKEMKEIEKAKKVLSRIPDANKYFSVMDVKKCQLGELTEDDIKGKNCDAIDVYHVKNQMRDAGYDNTVALLQQKNLGMPFDQYVLKEVKSGDERHTGQYEGTAYERYCADERPRCVSRGFESGQHSCSEWPTHDY